MACYDGFGNLTDGKHPIWVGDFNGNGRADILFFYYGDKNWFLGSHQGPGGQITWPPAGNTTNLGNLPEGCPVWIGNFSGSDRAEVLFYFPGDGNWGLGSYDGSQLNWNYAGNTAGANPGDPNFGQVWDGRPFWIGNFSHSDRAEVLFYSPGDGNWWLGSHDGNQLRWTFAGNTSGYQPPARQMAPECQTIANNIRNLRSALVSLADERDHAAPADKPGIAKEIQKLTSEITKQDKLLDACLTQHPQAQPPAYPNLGDIADGRPVWIGNFSGSARAEVLFYFPGDGNWWLGSHDGTQLKWNYAGNTSGTNPGDPNFGQLWDSRPFWIGNFSSSDRAEVLFYSPGDGHWWLGSHDGNQLHWTFAGNTSGYQPPARQMAPECQTIANNIRNLRSALVSLHDELTHAAPADKPGIARQIQELTSEITKQNKLLAACLQQHSQAQPPAYPNLGDITDGRPVWIGNFSGSARAEVLFYFPGDGNWWLGSHDGSQLNWNYAGNTSGANPGDHDFGQVWDSRPFWIGNFSRSDRAEVLFYFPGDGNWWLGSHDGSQLRWTFAGNTGRPYTSRIRLHFKSLVSNVQNLINDQVAGIREVYDTASILVEVGPFEDLSGNASLANLVNLDVGGCWSLIWPFTSVTAEQDQLFQNRNNVGINDIVIYIVQTATATNGPLAGCAAHPFGRPGAVIIQASPRWVLAHEVGHVLGLSHVDNTVPGNQDRLMWDRANWTNTPPDLISTEIDTMRGSGLTIEC